MPESLCKKLSTNLSADNNDIVKPLTTAITEPFSTLEPSSIFTVNSKSLSICERTYPATGRPAIIPLSFAIITPSDSDPSGMNILEVISPVPISSFIAS